MAEGARYEAADISHTAIWSPRLQREVCFNDGQDWPCRVMEESLRQAVSDDERGDP